MAKLGSYYGLCPIIDQKSLLGINSDAEVGHVLVTLGKNIAIKYKLSDQKQLTSWRTKEKFTSPVIYHKQKQQYCAVFNQTYLKLWSDKNEHLDQYKKLKFNKPIHTVINCEENTFLVFQNGATILLDKALEERKEFEPISIVKENETITDVFIKQYKGMLFGGLMLEMGQSMRFVYNLLDDTEEHFSLKLDKDGVDLSGYVLTVNNLHEFVLLTLWSDGKMFSYSLRTKTEEFVTHLDSISCKEPVTIVALNDDYLAMYGADNSQEGALLIIYNIQFKVTQCKQPFKLYTSGTKIWCLEDNLFLCVGQNIAVVPHHLGTEHLSTLIGSHKGKSSDPDIMIIQELVVTKWDDTKRPKQKKTPYNARVQELSSQGWSESAITEEVIPKHIEDNDLESIMSCLSYFKDIPEHYIVKLLNYLLSLDGKYFKSKSNNSKLPISLAPIERCNYLDKILMLPLSSVVLLPQLRAHLQMNNALLLLRYICYLLSEDGHVLSEDIANDERKLVDWACVLLDANYQRFILTKDQKITEVLIYFMQLVKANLCCLNDLRELSPVVASLKSGRYQNNKNVNTSRYSIEEIKL